MNALRQALDQPGDADLIDRHRHPRHRRT
jgi:hypothetical protein